jgi:hypothetical protein
MVVLSLAAGNIRNSPRRLIQAIHSAIKIESIVASTTIAALIQVSIVGSLRSAEVNGKCRAVPSRLKMRDLQGLKIGAGVAQTTRCGFSRTGTPASPVQFHVN